MKNNIAPGNHLQLEYTESGPQILKEKVAAALRKLKTHRSPGVDNIRTCNGTWPEDWNKLIYISIHK